MKHLDTTTPTPARMAAMAAFVIVAFALLTAMVIHLSGMLFVLSVKKNPTMATFGAIVTYWNAYSDDPLLRKKLVGSVGAPGVVFWVILPVAMVRASRQRRSLHGDARFLTASEVAQSDLACGNGIFLGRFGDRLLFLGGALSVLLCAPTRSGKGTAIVIPNLLNFRDSAVTLDIKGENYRATAGYRAEHGQEVYCFAPFDRKGRTHCWNPLSYVSEDPLHRVGDLLEIGDVFYPNEGTGTSSENFFNDGARNVFLALGLYLLETPELPRTIGEMLRQASGKGQPLREYLTGVIQAREKSGRPLTPECVDALNRLLTNSDNTMTSIVSTFTAPLTIFADAIVDAATSRNDFHLGDVRKKRMSIYVVIPQRKRKTARRLVNLFFTQLVNENTEELPEENPALRYQCLLVLDEFTMMGRIPAINEGVAYLSGYGLRLLTIVQANSQLESVMGERDARTFVTNHAVQLLYAPRERRDSEEYSALLGFATEKATSRGRSNSHGPRGGSSTSTNESDQRRALLLPQELREMGTEQLIIIKENSKPILANKVRYFRDPVFKARLRRPPAVPALDMKAYFARIRRQASAAAQFVQQVTASPSSATQDFSNLPPLTEQSGPEEVQAFVEAFFACLVIEPATGHAGTEDADGESALGGAIEPVADPSEEANAPSRELANLEP